MSSITYEQAGVSVEAGDEVAKMVKTRIRNTLSKNVLSVSGGFAGFYDISDTNLRSNGKTVEQPVLVTSTDGVGTKVVIATAIDKHDTIGDDLVAMVVDDIVVSGATPLFMTDYICCGQVIPTRISEIVLGVANACAKAGVSLVGGETAEHPGLLEADEYDIAGAATGIVDKRDILDPKLVSAGDVIVGLAASGLHSNGFSLVRAVVDNANWSYSRAMPELGTSENPHPTLGEVLLTPTRIYTKLCLSLLQVADIHAFSHITGGGIASNLARILPKGAIGVVERSKWEVSEIFNIIKELGNVKQQVLESTLNMGLGMLAVVNAGDVKTVLATSENAGVDAFVVGKVEELDTFRGSGEIVGDTKGVDGGRAVLV
ncbi:MAG: phosphoribosylformylglycinamidine cyclo-ligase [Candidatus Ancillula trichonymphae]|jgi:phosphoribosylformylglycinamidine cyclo-ligase|nr:phosphoribosylformylglycinamidine cyclo-ligase [Candidatus Ancillula trichonymphae]